MNTAAFLFHLDRDTAGILDAEPCPAIVGRGRPQRHAEQQRRRGGERADAARARPVTDQRRDAGPPQGARSGDAEDRMRHERQAVRPRRADVREVDARPGGHEQQHDTGAHGAGHTRQDRQRQHRDDDPAHGVEGNV